MISIKNALHQLGFNTLDKQKAILELLFRAGCFQHDQLALDLKHAGFTTQEITYVKSHYGTNDASFENFTSQIGAAFNAEADETPQTLLHALSWLDVVLKRILPHNTSSTSKQHAWLHRNEAMMRNLASAIARVEYAAQLQTNNIDAVSSFIILGGTYQSLLYKNACLKAVIGAEQPIAHNAWYLPFERATSSAQDGETGLLLDAMFYGETLSTEYDLCTRLISFIKGYLQIQPNHDANRFAINAFKSDSKSTSAALDTFARSIEHAELFTPGKKLLFITTIDEQANLLEALAQQFGKTKCVDFFTLCAHASSLETFQSLAKRVEAQLNKLKNELNPQINSASLIKPALASIGLFAGAVVAGALILAKHKEAATDTLELLFGPHQH